MIIRVSKYFFTAYLISKHTLRQIKEKQISVKIIL